VVKKVLFLAAVVYTIALVIVTLVDLNDVPSLGSSFDDKIYHVLAYVGLGFLWLTYFRPIISKAGFLYVLAVLLVFGMFLELIQHQINSNRTFDILDLFSNCLGIVLGTIVANYCNIYKLNIFKALFILFIIN
jgi:glycopeptide antibiotics resistance protein